MTISPTGQSTGHSTGPAGMTDEELQICVMSPLAGCTSPAVDPDEWFPVRATAEGARAEAARALAVCAVCPVRAECLELSLRHWRGVGQYGIWGGLVEADRSALRPAWLSGIPATTLCHQAGSPPPLRGGRGGRGSRSTSAKRSSRYHGSLSPAG